MGNDWLDFYLLFCFCHYTSGGTCRTCVSTLSLKSALLTNYLRCYSIIMIHDWMQYTRQNLCRLCRISLWQSRVHHIAVNRLDCALHSSVRLLGPLEHFANALSSYTSHETMHIFQTYSQFSFALSKGGATEAECNGSSRLSNFVTPSFFIYLFPSLLHSFIIPRLPV